MKDLLKNVAIYGGFVALLVLIAQLVEWYPQYSRKSALHDFHARAAASNPGLPKSEALETETVKVIRKTLTEETNPAYRRYYAAQFFVASYLTNTGAREAYCSERGVDISTFIRAYERMHKSELAQARSVVGNAYEGSAQRKWGTEYRKQLDQSMNDYASSRGVSGASICGEFATNGEAQARELLFSRQLPMAHEILMGDGR